MEKVLWLTNIPSPYRVKFFNELAKNCELTVVCERLGSDERDDSWSIVDTSNFELVVLGGLRCGVAETISANVVKYIQPCFDHIVVTNYSDPTGIIAIATLKAKGLKYEIEGDGAFPGDGQGIKEKIKKWVISGAQICFSTSQKHDDYYNRYHARKIVRYPFTSIREDEIEIEMVEKGKLRNELSISERTVILAVGQFIYRKGFDVLIKAATKLSSDIGIYIIGGEATEEYRKLKESLNVQNVHFRGFMQPEELNKYYSAADIFVHPTREDIWGLVINEAMAHGLPVISTDRCIAAEELVTNDECGSIVPADDENSLANAISNLINRKCNRETIIRKISDYTVEKMALAHLNAWSK